jgi:hypothetical protein
MSICSFAYYKALFIALQSSQSGYLPKIFLHQSNKEYLRYLKKLNYCSLAKCLFFKINAASLTRN